MGRRPQQEKLFHFEGKKVEVTRIKVKIGDVAAPALELGSYVAVHLAGPITAIRFYRDKDKRLVREMVLDADQAKMTDELPADEEDITVTIEPGGPAE